MDAQIIAFATPLTKVKRFHESLYGCTVRKKRVSMRQLQACTGNGGKSSSEMEAVSMAEVEQ